MQLYYLRLRKEHPPQGKHNALQKGAYTFIVALGVISVLTGFAIYKPVQLAWLTALFGGYELARYWHFVAVWIFIAFTLLHVVLVFVGRSGVPPGDDHRVVPGEVSEPWMRRSGRTEGRKDGGTRPAETGPAGLPAARRRRGQRPPWLAACGWEGGPLVPKLKAFSRVNDWVGEHVLLSTQPTGPGVSRQHAHPGFPDLLREPARGPVAHRPPRSNPRPGASR